jgi:Domain of unknown function (DUF6484)
MTRALADPRLIEIIDNQSNGADALELLLADAQELRQLQPPPHASMAPLPGVAVGVLTGVDSSGGPLVRLPDDAASAGRPARTVVAIDPQRAGEEVVVSFENGDRHKPIILGMLASAGAPSMAEAPAQVQAKLDDDVLEFSANREITLRCGKASITLTRAGKVIIRGAYLLSRSSGVNRIKGGSVQIN